MLQGLQGKHNCSKLLETPSVRLHHSEQNSEDTQSSLPSWEPVGEGYRFPNPAEKELWYQSWSPNTEDMGGQGSDQLVGVCSRCLRLKQPTDKQAWSSSSTGLVLSSTCQRCRDTVPGALLGSLVSLLDSVSSEIFVFGPIGTEGRPSGVLSIDILDNLDVGQLLSCAEHHRWHQVLSVWHKAGWPPAGLQVITEELRPLSFGCGLSETNLAGISAQQLNDCITQYCDAYGYDPVELASI